MPNSRMQTSIKKPESILHGRKHRSSVNFFWCKSRTQFFGTVFGPAHTSAGPNICWPAKNLVNVLKTSPKLQLICLNNLINIIPALPFGKNLKTGNYLSLRKKFCERFSNPLIFKPSKKKSGRGNKRARSEKTSAGVVQISKSFT